MNKQVEDLKKVISNHKIITTSFGITIILGIETIRKINKYKLIKENKFTSSIVIAESPNINSYHKNTKKIIIPSKIETYIKNFTETLSKHLKEEDMKVVNANITAMNYHQSILDSIYQKLILKSSGYYNSTLHQISLNKFETDKIRIGFGGIYFEKDNSQNIEEALYHELLHAASSKENDGIYFTGFRQYPPVIGMSINEGYTELLNQRYFQKDKKDKLITYPYEVAVAKIVELIVGKEKMTSLYFNSDLKGLVEELSKYQSIDKIKKFISNLDTIYKISETKLLSDKQALLLHLENNVTIFLEETFYNKQINNPNNCENYSEIQKQFLLLLKEMSQNKYSRKHSIFYSAETTSAKSFYKLM